VGRGGTGYRVFSHVLERGLKVKHYPVGTQFMSRGKFPRLCTVTDVLTTTNLAGDVVSVRYVATHTTVGGQLVTDATVVDTTIAMGLATNA